MPVYAGVLLVMALFASACGDDDGGSVDAASPASPGEATENASAEPYVIGYEGDLSGPIAALDGPWLNGLNTYIQTLNDAGGVNGRLVEVNTIDDHSDVATATANFRQHVDSDALAVVGNIFSSVSSALAPLAERAEMPYVMHTTIDSLIDPARPYLFSIELPTPSTAKIYADFIAQLAERDGNDEPRIAVFMAETAAAQFFIETFSAEADERGWTITDVQGVKPTDTDVSAQAAAVVRSEPDYVAMYWHTPLTLLGVPALRQRGLDVPIINSAPASSETTFERLAQDGMTSDYYALRYAVVGTDPAVEAAQEMKAAAEAAGLAEGIDDGFFTGGYVTGILIEKALKACGEDCDRESFRDALESVDDLETELLGPAGYGPDKHSLTGGARFYRWDDAEDVTVAETEEWLTSGDGP